MITQIRLHTQQLSNPKFARPEDVVAWMGAVQAQDFTMAKWAVGIRTKVPALSAMEKAVAEGKILRLHILRPTWHFVSPENVRWMLQLTGAHIKKAWTGYAKAAGLGMGEEACTAAYKLLEKILRGKKVLSAEEISAAFERAGLAHDAHRVRYVLGCAEADGLLCGGAQKGNKNTYTLLAECGAAQVKELSKEEALSKLARLYFQSHSPASLQDFVWWSGLLISEAREAMALIKNELTEDVFGSRTLWVHDSAAGKIKPADIFHFLPSFDEYLISYKDRTDCLDLKYHAKAFNRFGTFYPVVLSGHEIVGTWSKNIKKGDIVLEPSFFPGTVGADERGMAAAAMRYKKFLLF